MKTATFVLVLLLCAGCTESGAPAPQTEEQTITEFNRLWGERKPVFRNRFFGISTLQHPMDAWIVQEILSEVTPDLLIETGTYHGGSAILWAMLLEQLNPRAEVITIDIEDRRDPRAVRHPLARKRVTFLLGSSTDPEIVAEVQRRAKGKRAVVLLDSLHTADHVLGELRAYAPLVPVGSYAIVQDTMVGPGHGIAKFLEEDPRFEADRERERFMLTNTVGGYLKRVR